MNGRDILIYLAIIKKGNYDLIYRAIRDKEHLNVTNEALLEEVKKINCGATTLIDEDFPKAFARQFDGSVPIVIFYHGDLSLTDTKNKKLTVIGSRNCTPYGESSTRKIVKELPEDVVVISGLARGIDTAALQAALDTNKKVIAIIGNGIDFCYPEENTDLFNKIIEKGGLILSEYPPKTPPDANNFRWRNRLLAMLCDGLLIGEGRYHSGTKITAGFALNYGKNIGCIPYQINQNSICNQLIKEGAYLIENANDAYELIK